jgi:hypothetical protein
MDWKINHILIFNLTEISTYQSTGGLFTGRCFGAMEIVNELLEPLLNKNHIIYDTSKFLSFVGKQNVTSHDIFFALWHEKAHFSLLQQSHLISPVRLYIFNQTTHLLLNNNDVGVLQYEQQTVGDSTSINYFYSNSSDFLMKNGFLILLSHLIYNGNSFVIDIFEIFKLVINDSR